MSDMNGCELPDGNPPDGAIRALIESSVRVAVVGLSDNPERDSHRVAVYLLEHGFEVIPVNPALPEVLGRKSYPSLSEVPGAVDIVDIFRKPEAIPEIVEQAIGIGARAVWMQLGLAHQASAERARAAGMTVVQSKCLKIEHARLTAAGGDR